MQGLLLSAVATLGLAIALPVAAQFRKAEDAVAYRKAGFTVMQVHFSRLAAMAQGRAPFDAASAQANAEIVAQMSKLPFAGFVEGTAGTEKGSPKAKVWSDRAKFDAAATKMQEEAAKLVASAKTLDGLKAQFGPTAGTCKACHDEFRNP